LHEIELRDAGDAVDFVEWRIAEDADDLWSAGVSAR
jgi:hypothetical protein